MIGLSTEAAAAIARWVHEAEHHPRCVVRLGLSEAQCSCGKNNVVEVLTEALDDRYTEPLDGE